MLKQLLALTALAALASACDSRAAADAQNPTVATDFSDAVSRELARIRVAADSVDAIFQPLPLLRPADEAAFRRFNNAAQLAVAQRYGIPPDTRTADLDRLVQAGRLIRVADTTSLWVVRKLDHSTAYLTPAAHALLTEIAERFQEALVRLGAPRFRLEVSSMLRSAENHEQLRRSNPNAAAGVSTHQYATTFDVAYNAFAPPAAPIAHTTAPQLAALMAETVAARRSRELMAILGRVLLELQADGSAMVTLEQLQPVYHITAGGR